MAHRSTSAYSRATIFPDRASSTQRPRLAEVIFEGVEGYTPRGDALGTILFDIELVDSLRLYREHAADM
jgi:hypothetical protein